MAQREEVNINVTKKPVHLSRRGFTYYQILLMYIGVGCLVAALTLLILGLIGDYVFLPNNPLKDANDAMASACGGLTLTWLGVAFLLLGALIVAITLALSENVEERETEKELENNKVKQEKLQQQIQTLN